MASFLMNNTISEDKCSCYEKTAEVRPNSTQQQERLKKRKRRRLKKCWALELQQSRNMSEKEFDANLNKCVNMVSKLGYTDQEISIAVDKLRDTGSEISYDSLIDTAQLVQDEQIETSVTQSYVHDDGYVTSGEDSDDDGTTADVDDDMTSLSGDIDKVKSGRKHSTKNFDLQLQRAIEKRKEHLRTMIDSMTFTCKLCHCSKASILLLPCGHLASCDDCLMDVRRCPITRCNKVVKGTKEVFFV